MTYTDSNLPTLVQSFYIYPEKDYLLTEFTLQGGAADVESNYMAPVTIDRMPAVLAEGDNRALFQPSITIAGYVISLIRSLSINYVAMK